MTLGLVTRLLEHEGALVETAGPGAVQAIVPDALRVELALPEAPLLAEDGREGSVACGYGTELFRAVVARATSPPVVAACEARLAPPKPRAPGGYDGLNVALRVQDEVVVAPGWSGLARLRLEAVADERRVVDVEAAISVEGACPIEPFRAADLDLEELDERPAVPALAVAEPALARAARDASVEALEPFREVVARRLRRDLLRVDGYFRDLDQDLAARQARSTAGEGLARKRDALPGERARRTALLRENATIRAKLGLVGVLFVRHPVLTGTIDVLRRKARRSVAVTYHPVLKEWLPLACEGCAAPIRALGACDDAVHVLCAACLAAARCPRCARGAKPLALAGRVELKGEDERVAVAVVAEVPRVAPAPRPRRTPAPPPVRPKRQAFEEHVLAGLERFPFALTIGELSGLLRSEPEHVKPVLAALVAEGLVEKTGKARGTRYRAARRP